MRIEHVAMWEAILRSLEAFRNWQPGSWEGIPSERLTAIEQVCHVRDIERDGYHRRIRRTLAEEMPILEGIPGEPLAVERRYFQANAEEVFADFRAARADTITLLSGLGPIELQRLALFEGRPVALHTCFISCVGMTINILPGCIGCSVR